MRLVVVVVVGLGFWGRVGRWWAWRRSGCGDGSRESCILLLFGSVGGFFVSWLVCWFVGRLAGRWVRGLCLGYATYIVWVCFE